MRKGFADVTEAAVQSTPGNIEASLVRLEGKIDRVIDNIERHGEELSRVRDRVHDHSNEIMKLTALNMPEKIQQLREDIDDHDKDLASLRSDFDQRKGALGVMKALWALIGFAGMGGIVAVVKLLGH